MAMSRSDRLVLGALCVALLVVVSGGRWAGHAYRLAHPVEAAARDDARVVPAPAPWWVHADEIFDSPELQESAQDQEAVWIGPSAAAMRPPPVPVQVGERSHPWDDGFRGLQKIADGAWLLRHVLPPARDERVFIAKVRWAEVLWSGGSHVSPPVALGFGAQVASIYVSPCAVRIAAHGGEVFRVRVECGADRETAPLVAGVLGDAFAPVPDASLTDHGEFFWRADYEQPEASARANAARISALGAAPPVQDVPPQLWPAYDRLTSPWERLQVWKGGGRGDDALLALVAAHRVDLLRAVLRGPNPEGRALAALALHDAHALDASDRQAIAALAAGSPYVAFGVEGHDDANGYMPASAFFANLEWPSLTQRGCLPSASR